MDFDVSGGQLIDEFRADDTALLQVGQAVEVAALFTVELLSFDGASRLCRREFYRISKWDLVGFRNARDRSAI